MRHEYTRAVNIGRVLLSHCTICGVLRIHGRNGAPDAWQTRREVLGAPAHYERHTVEPLVCLAEKQGQRTTRPPARPGDDDATPLTRSKTPQLEPPSIDVRNVTPTREKPASARERAREERARIYDASPARPKVRREEQLDLWGLDLDLWGLEDRLSAKSQP
jgi:hypothetical protein